MQCGVGGQSRACLRAMEFKEVVVCLDAVLDAKTALARNFTLAAIEALRTRRNQHYQSNIATPVSKVCILDPTIRNSKYYHG